MVPADPPIPHAEEAPPMTTRTPTDTTDTTDTLPVQTAASVPATVSPQRAVKQQLETYRPVIAALLPAHISEQHFVATVANACRKNPDLWACDPSSVLAGALRAAQLGLELNDERNLCYLIPRGKQATFQVGYGGVMELARRATPGLTFTGRAVYPNDEFDLDYGREQQLIHKPAMGDRGGEAYAWYVVARFPDGHTIVEALTREDVEYHRSFSKQPNGQMWTKSYDAAALKSCVHQIKRWLPASAELAKAVESDDQVLTLASLAAEVDEVDLPALEAGDA